MYLPEATPSAPIPESYEWVKILLAAVAGMLAGLIADPIRGVIQWRINVLRMEIAIHTDFLMLSVALETLKHGLVPPEKFWLGVNLPAYEYYWERSRELFYSNIELQTLRLQCTTVLLIKESVARKQRAFEEAEAELRKTIAPVIKFELPAKWHKRAIRRVLLRFVR